MKSKKIKKQTKAKVITASIGHAITPLGSRVLIKPFTKEELEKKSSFGILLPDSETKEKTEQGKVLAVGPGEVKDGKRIPPQVTVGDKVAFSKYGYEEISVDGQDLYLIKEENILAILK